MAQRRKANLAIILRMKRRVRSSFLGIDEASFSPEAKMVIGRGLSDEFVHFGRWLAECWFFGPTISDFHFFVRHTE